MVSIVDDDRADGSSWRRSSLMAAAPSVCAHSGRAPLLDMAQAVIYAYETGVVSNGPPARALRASRVHGVTRFGPGPVGDEGNGSRAPAPAACIRKS